MALFNDLGAVVSAGELVFSGTPAAGDAGNDGKLVYVNAGADWGRLYYNPSLVVGAGDMVQIAELGGGTTLTAADITVAVIV